MGRDEEDRAKGECSQQVCGGNGMDELLEALGYKVRSSDMADVAQKLEQLEKVMVSTPQENGICHLATDTVHYDPADLHGWVHYMLNEIDHNEKNDAVQSRVYNDDSDLRIIPGIASLPPPRNVEENTDQIQNAPPLRNSPIGSELEANSDTESRVPVVLVQETTGVRLVQALMACAEAIQQGDLNLADAFVNQIGLLAAAQGGAMGKVAYYFAQALTRRIYGFSPVETLDSSSSFSDMLHVNFYESCPYLKFAHFTANQAILEAFAAATTVHVIDFGLNQGLQWPALMQALALRPGGPPSFRLTGIGPPLPDNTDYLQQVGCKLAQLAESIGVPFEFRGFACNSFADLDPFVLEIRPGESVAVNCVFELHRLLARPGTLEKVLDTIRGINPEIVTLVEQEANHNGPVFLDRFTEALHYYSSLFDSLAGSFSGQSENTALMSEVFLGRQICDVVAREGEERVERHETLSHWRVRMGSAGFEPVRLGSNAFRQARMLLALFTGGDGYRVEENNGCLMLGWHTRPLIATSAWRVAATELDELTRLI